MVTRLLFFRSPVTLVPAPDRGQEEALFSSRPKSALAEGVRHSEKTPKV